MTTGYNFTERVRKVLAFSREVAVKRENHMVTPEHIALGLLDEGGGVAYAVLDNHHVPLDELRRTLESHLPAPGPTPMGELPFTMPAKKVLERSMQEARDLKHSYVGTEHLLLGLLHDDGTPTARAFAQHGVTKDNARAWTLRLLGPENPF